MLATARDTDERTWEKALLACVNGTRTERITPLVAFRAGRRRLGLSVTQFADALGIYPAAALCWEQGRRPVPAWVLERLRRYLAARTA